MPVVPLLRSLTLITLFCAFPIARAEAEEKNDEKYPRVFRTFMPDAGPSAFAVELSPDLALCYDPLRGGVNEVWTGKIDLSPTLRAKINEPAKIVGTVFYREALRHPLKIGKPDSQVRFRFKGYHYENGAVVFEFTLNGHPVTEKLRAAQDGRSLVREFTLPGGGGPAFLSVESQAGAVLTVQGGKKVRTGLWKFTAASPLELLITPKTEGID